MSVIEEEKQKDDKHKTTITRSLIKILLIVLGLLIIVVGCWFVFFPSTSNNSKFVIPSSTQQKKTSTTIKTPLSSTFTDSTISPYLKKRQKKTRSEIDEMISEDLSKKSSVWYSFSHEFAFLKWEEKRLNPSTYKKEIVRKDVLFYFFRNDKEIQKKGVETIFQEFEKVQEMNLNGQIYVIKSNFTNYRFSGLIDYFYYIDFIIGEADENAKKLLEEKFYDELYSLWKEGVISYSGGVETHNDNLTREQRKQERIECFRDIIRVDLTKKGIISFSISIDGYGSFQFLESVLNSDIFLNFQFNFFICFKKRRNENLNERCYLGTEKKNKEIEIKRMVSSKSAILSDLIEKGKIHLLL